MERKLTSRELTDWVNEWVSERATEWVERKRSSSCFSFCCSCCCCFSCWCCRQERWLDGWMEDLNITSLGPLYMGFISVFQAVVHICTLFVYVYTLDWARFDVIFFSLRFCCFCYCCCCCCWLYTTTTTAPASSAAVVEPAVLLFKKGGNDECMEWVCVFVWERERFGTWMCMCESAVPLRMDR